MKPKAKPASKTPKVPAGKMPMPMPAGKAKPTGKTKC